MTRTRPDAAERPLQMPGHWHRLRTWWSSPTPVGPVIGRRRTMPVDASARGRSRQERLDQMAERLTSAVDSLVSGADWRAAMEFAARFRSRSFGNTLLIRDQHLRAYDDGRVPGPEPTWVAGYEAWRRLGRQVVGGQAGYAIYAPVTERYATRDVTDTALWRRLGRSEKPRPGEAVRTRVAGFRPAYVWDVSQTDGTPIPEPPKRPVLLRGEAPAGLVDAVTGLLAGEGFTVAVVADGAGLGGANGMANYSDRTVRVRGDLDDAAITKTLLHELAHVRLHDPDGRGRPGHRGVREVEAESVAMMIGACYGLDTTGYTIPYVAGWSSSIPNAEPADVVRRTGDRVRTAALAILDELPTPPVADGLPPGLTRSAPAARPEHMTAAPPPEHRAAPNPGATERENGRSL